MSRRSSGQLTCEVAVAARIGRKRPGPRPCSLRGDMHARRCVKPARAKSRKMQRGGGEARCSLQASGAIRADHSCYSMLQLWARSHAPLRLYLPIW